MILHQVDIVNFKNIEECRATFSPKVNCMIGNNGQGKTNMLDAIYYLSFTKSFFGINDRLVIRQGADYLMLRGKYSRKGDAVEVGVTVQPGKGKKVKRDSKEYRRMSEHIGLLPIVMVSPLDGDLIRGGSEGRRKLMDMIISQGDAEYLSHLIRHGKAIEHRNSLIRQGYTDPLLFASVESQIVASGTYLHAVRSRWVERFEPIFMRYYEAISGGSEKVQLRYTSHLNDASAAEVLERNRNRDLAIGYTSAGAHRDDIDLLLDGLPMRTLGSQGQCKTYTVALRLAQYDFLRQSTGVKPILLLDDIFDKLDSNRVGRIIGMVQREDFGQIFISDTNRAHLDEMVCHMGDDYRIFVVDNGNVQQIDGPTE